MAASDHYREYAPRPELTDSIECVWTSRLDSGPHTARHRILPDGCMDVLFDFSGSTNARASIIGTLTRPQTFTTDGVVELLGIRFRPGGLPALIPLDAAELTDAQTGLATFWGRLADEMWSRLAETDGEMRVSRALEILTRLQPGPQDPFVRHSVRRIELTRGALRVVDLEKSTGLTARQLERKFAQHLGVPPKTFARVVRFRRLAAAVKASKTRTNWARLAAEFGFSDQSHMVREIRALSGRTPVELLANAGVQAGDVGFLQDGRTRHE